MSKAPKLSIVVPCYNEAENIPLVLRGFAEAFTAHNGREFAELIIVDNNSKDGTAEILKRELAKPEYSFARSVFEPQPGYGAAIKRGLRAAQGEVLAWTHGDVQTDPAEVFKAYDVFVREDRRNVIVKGNRVGRPKSQALFSFGMAVVASVILSKRFFEINAQPKLFSRQLLPHVLQGPDDFSLDLYLLSIAKERSYPIRTIDVRFLKRIHGESKWAFSFSAKVKTIWRTVKYVWNLRARTGRGWAFMFLCLAVAMSFFVHAGHRTAHFQECDSALVYDALANFPRSALAFNATTYPSRSFISEETARNILEFDTVQRITDRFVKDFNTAELVRRIANTHPMALFRLALVTASAQVPLPSAVEGAIALPLSSTYSPGPGFFYGMLISLFPTYEGFMSAAALLTLLVFHASVVLFFLAVVRVGVHSRVALVVSLIMLFSVSLYSYGYHLGSTVWNVATGIIWLWFLARSLGARNELRVMSWVTGALAFFNYLIVLYWLAHLAVRIVAALPQAPRFMRDYFRTAWGIGRTQLGAVLLIGIVAVLFYPPGHGNHGLPSLGELPQNLYYIVLNFFTMYLGSDPLRFVQFVIGAVLIAFGAVHVTRTAKASEVSVQSVLAAFFLIAVLAVAFGVLGFVPSRHVLFLTPGLFLVVVFGLHSVISLRIPAYAIWAVALFLAGSGFLSLIPRMQATQDVMAGVSLAGLPQEVVVADCPWPVTLRPWGGIAPTWILDKIEIHPGATYGYVSQLHPLSKTLREWNIPAEILLESAEERNVYFAAHNPYQLIHTRPNSIFWGIFRTNDAAGTLQSQ